MKVKGRIKLMAASGKGQQENCGAREWPRAHFTAEQIGAEATPSVLPRGGCDTAGRTEPTLGGGGESLGGKA